jgi:hypothetical protein
MGIFFYSKQSIFSIEIQCRKFTELLFEAFVTHLSYMSHKFFLGGKWGRGVVELKLRTQSKYDGNRVEINRASSVK